MALIMIAMTIRRLCLRQKVDGYDIIIIIIAIFKCYFSREHITLSHIKLCERSIWKKQRIKSTAHDVNSCFK